MSGRWAGSLPPVKVQPNRRCTVVGTKFVEITALAIISTSEVYLDSCLYQVRFSGLRILKWGLHPRELPLQPHFDTLFKLLIHSCGLLRAVSEPLFIVPHRGIEPLLMVLSCLLLQFTGLYVAGCH